MTLGLVKYDAARKALAEAHRIDEVKKIHDAAEAARIYGKLAQDFEFQNMAAEIRLRAERRAGELLKEMKERGERDAGKGGNRKSHSQETSVKLDDLGITYDQSSKWQKVATIPEPVFQKVITRHRNKHKELTTAAVLKAAQPKKKDGTTGDVDLWDAAPLVARVINTAHLVVKDWPRVESYDPLISALRDYLDILEESEFNRRQIEQMVMGRRQIEQMGPEPDRKKAKVVPIQ